MFRIKCRVSGGVTGTREAYLKENGEEVIYLEEDTAKYVARELNEKANGPYRTADFSYTVEPA